MKEARILWFNEIGIVDVPLVGGKNASLGEMYRKLTKKGVNVPNGFAVTASAYRYFIEEAGIKDKIHDILKDLNTHNIRNLQERGKKVRQLILNSEFPEDLKTEISKHYKKLGKNVDVAVRSSATAEDLPDASFAGQQETYLNIVGDKALMEASKKCFASLFTDRAISYREDKGFSHFDVYLSIGVQKMVRSDLASSGVMFSIDTESGFSNVVYVTSAYGLGENVVQGAVNPDEFYVFKPTLKLKKNAVLSRKLGSKKIKMIYDKKKVTKNINVSAKDRLEYAINDKEVMQLAKWAVIIENHYNKAMDMEWAKDGRTGKLFIVQARPETVQSQKDLNKLETYKLTKKGKILVEGKSVGSKIGSGKVSLIKNVKDIHKFKKGDVLVTEMTDPDWEPIMKIASAIVTNRGGRTCHAAIISRELGIPCVVATENGTLKIKHGSKVTVSCAEGENGYVYSGKLPFKIETVNLKNIPKTKTKIQVNLGDPDSAFEMSQLPVQGVGLAREEFIINSFIGIHPNALINYKKLDSKLKAKIDKKTYGYKDKTKFFVDKLAEGVAKITAAFYPNEVVVRFSDFKTNEYATLLGGELYEPLEDNPMIGFRGSSRYYDDKFKTAFGLECKAMKKVRDEMGLTNLVLMVPFCRTVSEGKQVLKIMKKNGLKRKRNKLKVYVMCEVPSNVILAEKFLDIFDGFSIGSNDLTQLTLGLDRDSEIVSHIYDERNEAVLSMIETAIKVAKKKKKHIGICGDAPSTYPEFTEFLVKNGIDSISLSPDAVVKTLLMVAKLEKKKR